MRIAVASEDRIKKAFREAYDFMESHNELLADPVEYKDLARDAQEAYAKYDGDPLTRNLIYAVFSTVVEISDLVWNLGGKNDTAGTIERS